MLCVYIAIASVNYVYCFTLKIVFLCRFEERIDYTEPNLAAGSKDRDLFNYTNL